MNKLKKKKYLTFDELLNRWNCKKEDLHYHISEGELKPSIAWNDWADIYFWERSAENSKLFSLESLKNEEGTAQSEFIKSWIFLQRPEITGVSKYTFSLATLEAYPEISKPSKWYRLRATLSAEYSYLANIESEKIETDGIFMMKQVEDCELSYRSSVADKPLHPRVENNYLRLIFALANNIEGFNHKKPHEAAQLILDENDKLKIGKETLALIISNAYKLNVKDMNNSN